MQIEFFVFLYRFFNQDFGNLARAVITFVTACMQKFILSGTVNKCMVSYHLAILRVLVTLNNLL